MATASAIPVQVGVHDLPGVLRARVPAAPVAFFSPLGSAGASIFASSWTRRCFSSACAALAGPTDSTRRSRVTWCAAVERDPCGPAVLVPPHVQGELPLAAGRPVRRRCASATSAGFSASTLAAWACSNCSRRFAASRTRRGTASNRNSAWARTRRTPASRTGWPLACRSG